jgi:hypothetical protein
MRLCIKPKIVEIHDHIQNEIENFSTLFNLKKNGDNTIINFPFMPH